MLSTSSRHGRVWWRPKDEGNRRDEDERGDHDGTDGRTYATRLCAICGSHVPRYFGVLCRGSTHSRGNRRERQFCWNSTKGPGVRTALPVSRLFFLYSQPSPNTPPHRAPPH